MRLDPKLVVQFAVIADEGSITKAAERLWVAQPWLSARLRKLENQLGFALFTRTTRSMTLTERGRELLQAARGVHESLIAMEALASQLQLRDDRRLTLGWPPYSSQIDRRRELIEQFMAAHPDIKLEIDTGWSPKLVDAVSDGSLELAFVMGDLHTPIIQSVVVSALRVEVLMAHDHPLTGLATLSSSDLKGQTIAAFMRTQHPELFDSIFSTIEIPKKNLVQIVEINEALLARARSSEHLIIATISLRDENPLLAGMVKRPLENSRLIPFSIIRRASKLSPEAQLFWNLASGWSPSGSHSS